MRSCLNATFDLGFHGVPWTYNNKQEGNKNVKVRLDRAVACPQWSSIFPDCKVTHIISSRSDHCPLLIELMGAPRSGTFIKHLKYEAYWEREDAELQVQIDSCWNNNARVNNLGDVANNLDKLMKSLHGWSQVDIGYLPKKLESARKRLSVLFNRSDHKAIVERKKILKEMDELLLKEEIMWKQRSCLNKMKWGDRNTKKFHRKATWRAKKNNISAIKRRDGSLSLRIWMK